jgi:hypothetical protein
MGKNTGIECEYSDKIEKWENTKNNYESVWNTVIFYTGITKAC